MNFFPLGKRLALQAMLQRSESERGVVLDDRIGVVPEA